MKFDEVSSESADGRDPFEVIRTHDPAMGMTPDLAGLRSRIDARIADHDHADFTVGPDLAIAQVQDLAAARHARRGSRRWLQVAAAAAGVVAIGLGGYFVGTQGSTAPDLAKGAVTTHQGMGAPEISLRPGGVPEVAGRDDTKMAGVGSRTVFSAGSNLTSTQGSATIWTLKPQEVFGAATLQSAADTLGIAGEVRQDAGNWTIGDSAGQYLQLMPDGVSTLSYYDAAKDPYRCAEDAKVAAASGSSVPAACAIGLAPVGEAAIDQARTVLADLGVDVTALSFSVIDQGTAEFTFVAGDLLLDGKPSGVSWGVGLVADGVQSLNGPLAPVQELGVVRTISAVEAVQRMADPRFGSGGGSLPYLSARGAEVDGNSAPASAANAGDEAVPPSVATAGAPIPWPVSQVTITSAELVTTLQFQADGSALLLPFYQLSDGSGAVWTVLAVADSELNFTE